MAVDTCNERRSSESSGWEEDIPEHIQGEIASPQWTLRSVIGVMAVFGLVLALGCYAGSRKLFGDSTPSASPSPSAAISQPVEGELARSLREIEALKKALSEQSGTNQQMAASIAALRSDQQELRQQMTAIRQAAIQKSTSITGSINSRTTTPARARASKQAQKPPLNLAGPNWR